MAITDDDLKRLALIAGFKDRSLAEKCLGEEYDLRRVIATAVTRESIKAKAGKVQEAGSAKQVKEEEGDMLKKLEKLQGDMDTVMKLQINGKYSGLAKKTCSRCTFNMRRTGSVQQWEENTGGAGRTVISPDRVCARSEHPKPCRRVKYAELPPD